MPKITIATTITIASSFHPIPAMSRSPDDMRTTFLLGIRIGPSIRPQESNEIWTSSRHLADFLRPSRVERVIDQRLHPLDETHRMGQAGVDVEGRFIFPA